jgi:hypothetical protein
MSFQKPMLNKLAAVAGVLALSAVAQSASAAQTQSYVVSWFTQATYSQDGDCSKGLNPSIEKIYANSLAQQGFAPDKITKLMDGFNGVLRGELGDAIENRARVGGKPANIYQNPTGQPDTNLNPVDGKFGRGFNLDGKSVGPQYEDPFTKETGVDNNYYRAVGCTNSHRGFPPDRSTFWAYEWDSMRSTLPGWILSVTGEDLSKDGDVTVRFERALESVPIDANGNARRNATYRIASDPRSQNEFKGRIKDQILYVDSGHLHLTGEPFFFTDFDLLNTRMRLELKPDGSIDGILGGYQEWMKIYYTYGSGGTAPESMIGFDTPGFFYSLRRWADAYPDPKTGENTRISATYRLELVPAFAVRPNDLKADSGAARTAQSAAK